MPLNTLEDAAALLGGGEDEGEVESDDSSDLTSVIDDVSEFFDNSVKKKDVDVPDEDELFEASETAEPDAAPVAAKPVVTSKEERKQELEVRLANLAARRKEQALSRQLEERERALERRQAEIDDRARKAEELETTWRSATKDPVEAFRKLGVSATDVFDKITAATIQEDSPEAREARKFADFKKSILEELAPSLKELEELRGQSHGVRQELARRAQYEAAQHQKSLETQFTKLANSPGYEDIADYYEESELVALGNHLANEMSSSGHQFQNGVKDVLDELASRLRGQLKRAEERRTKRSASSPVAATQPKGEVSSTPAKTTTIGNSVAGSSATSGTRARTEAERRLEAEKLYKSLMK